MAQTTELTINPKLDLVFERTTTLTPEQIWKGWTDRETLMNWFCPRPWKVTECRMELTAGGEFYTLMQGPGGEQSANNGCFLQLVPNQKLVWTNSMQKGFRPVNPKGNEFGFLFTGHILISKFGDKTLYRGIVCHQDEEGRNQHEKMGFQEGWGMAFDQLIELYGAK